MLAGSYMRKGIGEAVGESGEPPVSYPKDLSFIGFMREVFFRLSRIYLLLIPFLGGIFLILQLIIGFDPFIWAVFLVYLLMLLLLILICTPITYLSFRFQRIFTQYNRVFFDGANIVIDHTEWPNSPWIRNTVPIASISFISQAGKDYWISRKGIGTFGDKLRYPSHLPPEGGLYHSFSDPGDLFVIYLGREHEIETPNRKWRMFHAIWSYNVWVKEIVIAVGKDHHEEFLRALNRKGVKVKRPRAEPQPALIEQQAMNRSVRFG